MRELNQINEKLRKNCATLTESKLLLTEKMATATSSSDQTIADLTEKQSQIPKLQKELTTLQENSLEQKAMSLTKIKALERENYKVSEQLRVLKSEMQQMQEIDARKIDSLSRSCKEKDETLDRLESNDLLLRQRLENLEQDYQVLKVENDQKDDTITELESALEELDNHVGQMNKMNNSNTSHRGSRIFHSRHQLNGSDAMISSQISQDMSKYCLLYTSPSPRD